MSSIPDLHILDLQRLASLYTASSVATHFSLAFKNMDNESREIQLYSGG